MTSTFAQNRKRPSKKPEPTAKEKAVVEKGADKVEKPKPAQQEVSLDPDAPANKSMTFPMNEYEIWMLQEVAAAKSKEFKIKVSMRQIGRQMLARALEEELGKN